MDAPTPRDADDDERATPQAKSSPPETQRPIVVPLGAHQMLRDEFTCPITRQLMRQPVIAADGHTYDRQAIETWLLTHDTSPKSGEVLSSQVLVPNHNLKRLVDDLVREGGAGLYEKCEEKIERHACIEKEPVLLLKCLGPAESEWHGRTFEVRSEGCIGGRRRGDDDTTLFMAFGDATVSRRHFEISRQGDGFYVSDLKSASGTFTRLRAEHALTTWRGLPRGQASAARRRSGIEPAAFGTAMRPARGLSPTTPGLRRWDNGRDLGKEGLSCDRVFP